MKKTQLGLNEYAVDYMGDVNHFIELDMGIILGMIMNIIILIVVVKMMMTIKMMMVGVMMIMVNVKMA